MVGRYGALLGRGERGAAGRDPSCMRNRRTGVRGRRTWAAFVGADAALTGRAEWGQHFGFVHVKDEMPIRQPRLGHVRRVRDRQAGVDVSVIGVQMVLEAVRAVFGLSSRGFREM